MGIVLANDDSCNNASERERVEYLVTLYERLRAPLASVAAAKPRRRRRRK